MFLISRFQLRDAEGTAITECWLENAAIGAFYLFGQGCMLLYHFEFRWISFAPSCLHVLTKNKATEPRFRPQAIEMFQWTVKPSNQLKALFTVVEWSMSVEFNTPYRSRLCSHYVFHTVIERQTPNTLCRYPYIPCTCHACIIIQGSYEIRWDHRVRNDEVLQRTGQAGYIVTSSILSTPLSVWARGLARWRYTCKQVSSSPYHGPPDRLCRRRPPGGPRNKWLRQLRDGSNRPVGDLCLGPCDDLGRLRDDEDDDDDRSRDTAIKATFHHDRCKTVWVCGPRTLLSLAIIWNTIVYTIHPYRYMACVLLTTFLQFIGSTMQL